MSPQHSTRRNTPHLTAMSQQRVMGTSAARTTADSCLVALPTTAANRASQQIRRHATALQQYAGAHNSSLLKELLLGDILVGVGVTFGVAPFLCVVDKAIVQHAAGTKSISKSIMASVSTMARNPVSFIKSPTFLLMWGVYAATYATANSLKTVSEHTKYHSKQQQHDNTTSSSFSRFGVFAGTTLVNSVTSLYKDRAYARMYGTSGVASMPWITYGLWATRDCLVIGSSFVLPEMVSKRLDMEDETRAKQISQVICPIATQFLATPIQLLGLDYYNRPKSTLQNRARSLVRGFPSVVMARIARIAPAYAVGGVLNTHYRDEWRRYLIQREVSKIQSTATVERRQSVKNLVRLVVAENHKYNKEKS